MISITVAPWQAYYIWNRLCCRSQQLSPVLSTGALPLSVGAVSTPIPRIISIIIIADSAAALLNIVAVQSTCINRMEQLSRKSMSGFFSWEQFLNKCCFSFPSTYPPNSSILWPMFAVLKWSKLVLKFVCRLFYFSFSDFLKTSFRFLFVLLIFWNMYNGRILFCSDRFFLLLFKPNVGIRLF